MSDVNEIVLRRPAAHRRKMLMAALPLSLLGAIAIVVAFAVRGAGLLFIPGILFFAPLLVVLDQGWVEVRLTPEGFTIRRAGSSLTVPWGEVDHFYLRSVTDLVRGSSKVVTISFRDARPTFPLNKRALAGYISSVGMDPDAELELLETWRRRWSR